MNCMQCGEVLVLPWLSCGAKKLFWTSWKSKNFPLAGNQIPFFPFVQQVVWSLFRATKLLNCMSNWH